jgi:hypothetical protein
MKKQCKTTCKTAEGGKTNGSDSWGNSIPGFVVEG